LELRKSSTNVSVNSRVFNAPFAWYVTKFTFLLIKQAIQTTSLSVSMILARKAATFSEIREKITAHSRSQLEKGNEMKKFRD